MWTLIDVVKVCLDSSANNFTELVGSHDKKVNVEVYNWKDHLSKYFKAIPNILEYPHFRMSKESPGIVCCLKHLNGEVDKIKTLKNHANINQITAAELPSLVAPKGFTDDRKNYLFNDIRPFCKIGTENEVAPPPST